MSRMSTSALERRLTDALRGDADRAPMPERLLQVPDAWVRPRQVISGQLAAAGVVALAAAIMVAVLVGIGVLGQGNQSVGTDDVAADAGVQIEALDVAPRPGEFPELGGAPAIGPIVEVARGRVAGTAFRFTAYHADSSIPTERGIVCSVFHWLPDEDVGCGAMPGEPGTIGEVFGMGAHTHPYGSLAVHGYYGLVALEVAEVWIETEAGTRARARLVPLDGADIDAQLFMAFLPGGLDSSAWVALDAAGTEIGRIPTPPGPSDDPGANPQPAP
jgi:hypothetical protein